MFEFKKVFKVGRQKEERSVENKTTQNQQNTTDTKSVLKKTAAGQNNSLFGGTGSLFEHIKTAAITADVVKATNNTEYYFNVHERTHGAVESQYFLPGMARTSLVTTGIVSGVANLFESFKNKKDLADALRDMSRNVAKSTIRGGTMGVVSEAIRHQGVKAGSTLLSDPLASAVMAGGIIEGGVALYSYAKGEIGQQELTEALVETTAKATTAVYYTKAVSAIMGKQVNPVLPIAVYTTASYVYTATREIIKDANLKAEEYNRMTELLRESTKQINEYQKQLEMTILRCEESQRQMLNGFIDTFNYNLLTGENYDEALCAIVKFANQAGMALQHVSFDDFSGAMRTKTTFVLE